MVRFLAATEKLVLFCGNANARLTNHQFPSSEYSLASRRNPKMWDSKQEDAFGRNLQKSGYKEAPNWPDTASSRRKK